MVSLQVALDDYLPVRAGHHPGTEDVALVELQRFQDGFEVAKPCVNIDLQPRCQADEDQSRRLHDRQLDQSAIGLVELTEGGLSVHALQFTVQAIAPGVIRAGECTGAPSSLTANQGAAMAANVQHRVDFAPGIAGENDRDTNGFDRLVRILLRQFHRQCQREWNALEQQLDFGPKQFLVGVVFHRLLEVARRLVGGLVAHVSGKAPHHGDGFFSGSAI